MIEERFLTAAINIRRIYFKLTSNLDSYMRSAEDTLKKFEFAYEELEALKEKIKDTKNPDNQNPLSDNLLRIIDDIESEGKRIEKSIEPLNKEIEKLAVEEQELYRNICDSHPDLSEEQIIDIVRKRLEKENLL